MVQYLITGGTGSFGTKFTEILLAEHDPESVRIFSRGELLQMEMNNKFNDSRLRFLIGDVRDKSRLSRAMNGVDIVVHAAALKQVPACEYNPIEAVRTNIDGAINVIDAALDNGVKKVIAISSDKAVHPVNLYGATKMVAEKLFIQANTYAGFGGTLFSVVRYGNVVGSRGSVIPVFKEQLKSGEITITDKRMTRFWLTLDEGVRFVLHAINRMDGGEIFVPKIPSMRISDIASVVAPGARIRDVGIRPGEKLHEILLTEDESRHARDLGPYYIIDPEYYFWKGKIPKPLLGVPLDDGFRYSSDKNNLWMSDEDLRKVIDE
jgi:UDP-N-acetylglucosamine 4,6-dehydratase (inverting)